MTARRSTPEVFVPVSRAWPRWALAALILLTLVWGAQALARIDASGNVRVAGHAPAPGVSWRSYLEAEARRWSDREVELRVGVHRFTRRRAQLGFGLPVADALAMLERRARSSNPLVGLLAWWQGRFGRGEDLPWRARRVDGEALERTLDAIAAEVARAPTAASRAVDGTSIPGLAGEVLDVQLARATVEHALARDAQAIALVTLITPPLPELRSYARPREQADVLMTRQETRYKPLSLGRARNIELAARKLDGASMMPGEALSFNRVVGKRTLAAGFAPALELRNGELALGVGGGVCQVAGTLHAAAFFAGLTVEEYRPHSRLAQFAVFRPGLDTMVAWPDHARSLSETQDLRLRNPYPFPVLVRARTERAGREAQLIVELYGAARSYRVSYAFEELPPTPAPELRRVDRTLSSGQQRVEREGTPGNVILRRRTIYTPTRAIEEVVRVSYPATPRIVRVAAD